MECRHRVPGSKGVWGVERGSMVALGVRGRWEGG